jgi:16S rRNA (cytosine1402-N4)-methyltransferase
MHVPVLPDEVLELMNIREGGVYIDGTMGSGGHSEAILERIGEKGMLLAIDRDEEALERCGRRLARFGDRCRRVHGNYSDIAGIAKSEGLDEVDGILLDLGVSSDQIDTAGRGFSFMHDGPLDMRMDRSQRRTAADVVNGMSERELVSILRKYGEEHSARKVAAVIVRRRAEKSFETTGDLAEVISDAKGGRRGRTHPATKSFQAIRMEVNGELGGVESGLRGGVELLRSGGRMAVITFHSLEDRIVKRFFAAHEGRWESLAAGGERWEGELPAMKRITRKPVQPAEAESLSNPRARSSKLRVAERIMSPYKRGQ